MSDNAAPILSRKHKEAFCLMTYRSDDGTETERLWNSRDGVTPFIITSRTGKKMTHVDWNGDRYAPNHEPLPGDRIFVDATTDLLRDRAIEYVNENWDRPDPDGMGLNMSAHPFFAGHDKEWAANHFLEEWTKPGSPYVLTVTAETTANHTAQREEIQRLTEELSERSSYIANYEHATKIERAERDAELSALRAELAEAKDTLKEHEEEHWCFNAEHGQVIIERDRLRAELEAVKAERDRQYEFNAGQIAKYAALEAEHEKARVQLEEAESLEETVSDARGIIEALLEYRCGIPEERVEDAEQWLRGALDAAMSQTAQPEEKR